MRIVHKLPYLEFMHNLGLAKDAISCLVHLTLTRLEFLTGSRRVWRLRLGDHLLVVTLVLFHEIGHCHAEWETLVDVREFYGIAVAVLVDFGLQLCD